MIDVDTEIEPPGLDGDEDAEDEPHIAITCAMQEADDTRRAAYSAVAPDADDVTIAAAMVETMVGAAAMRGPALVEALRWAMARRSRRG